MKKITTIMLSCLLANTTFAAETPTLPTAALIQAIQTTVANTDKHLPSYKAIPKGVMGISSEGGDLKYFYNKNSLVKLSGVFNNKNGYNTEDLYFENDKLIYLHVISHDYDQAFGKVVKEHDNRYYFSDGKLIEWISDNGNPITSPNTSLKNMENTLTKKTNQYLSIGKSNYTCVTVDGESFGSCDSD